MREPRFVAMASRTVAFWSDNISTKFGASRPVMKKIAACRNGTLISSAHAGDPPKLTKIPMHVIVQARMLFSANAAIRPPIIRIATADEVKKLSLSALGGEEPWSFIVHD